MMAPCEIINQLLGGMFCCTAINGYVRIRTPFSYPDGDLIDLFLRDDGDGSWTLTDLGESVRWLRMKSPSEKRSSRQKHMLAQAAESAGARLHHGQLLVHGTSENEIADSIIRLIEASIRVSDIYITFRKQADVPFVSEVAHLLDGMKRLMFKRDVDRVGQSGAAWKIDFQAVAPETISLVQVVSGKNRSQVRSAMAEAFSAWVDIGLGGKQSDIGEQLVTMFDDRSGFVEPADYRLLGMCSIVTTWSDHRLFKKTLLGISA